MSDTPKLPDECKKLLDNGWYIELFRNQLGSYTARGTVVIGEPDELGCYSGGKEVLTDDFEPSQALYRLTEKVFGRIA